jgi:hypothetical protein
MVFISPCPGRVAQRQDNAVLKKEPEVLFLELALVCFSPSRSVSIQTDHGDQTVRVDRQKKVVWDFGRATGYTGYLAEEGGRVILVHLQVCARGICLPMRKRATTDDETKMYRAAMLAYRD